MLLEAMAAGLPVIGGDIPGYASVITHQLEGLLVPPESEHALAIAMVRLLADQNARVSLGACGRLRAAEFSWPKVASQLLEFYIETRDHKLRGVRAAEGNGRFRGVLGKVRRAQ